MIRIETSLNIRNFNDLKELIVLNWEESRMPIEVNLDDTRKTYNGLVDYKLLFLVSAYDGEKAVGYCVVVLTPHMLNHSVKFVNVSGFYILPEYRNGRLVAKMMKEIREYAKHHNAHHIMWHAPKDTLFESTLNARFENMSSYFMELV